MNKKDEDPVRFAKSYSHLWRGSYRDVVVGLFDQYSGPPAQNNYIERFVELAQSVIDGNKTTRDNLVETSMGKWLIYDVGKTMFDWLAEGASNGFFDQADMPPPIFWISYQNGILMSFIPLEYVAAAEAGIECCPSNCIYWKSENL